MSKKQLKCVSSFKTLVEVAEYFRDEKTCIEHLKKWRWNGNPTCPHCKHEKVYEFSDGKRYKCAGCRKQFTATVGTIFHSKKISLFKWYLAIFLNSAHKKGISSLQLATHIGVTPCNAWYMLTKLRGTYKQSTDKIRGVVMCDESFIGGKNKNRHLDKKVKNSQGRSFKDKTPVLGLMHPDGYVRTIVMRDTSKKSVQTQIYKHVEEGTVVVSDEWKAYKGLSTDYVHEVVDHNRRQYVNDSGFTTNPMEGFWASLKRTYIGTYHNMSRKHLQKYVDEVTFRYNTRDLNSGERMEMIMQSINFKVTQKQIANEKRRKYYA
jgi:transposase-like protein